MNVRPARCLLIFALLLSGCSLAWFARSGAAPSFERRSCITPSSSSSSVRQAQLVNFGWHTGVLIASADVPETYRKHVAEFAQFPFVEIGWGDRDFYQTPGYSTLRAVRAAFFSPGSVLLVVGRHPELNTHLAPSEVIELEFTEEGFAKLVRYISDAFATDAEGRALPLAPALNQPGHFYTANGRFSILYTCNSWLSDALNAAGCNSGRHTTASSLMSAVRKLPAY